MGKLLDILVKDEELRDRIDFALKIISVLVVWVVFLYAKNLYIQGYYDGYQASNEGIIFNCITSPLPIFEPECPDLRRYDFH